MNWLTPQEALHLLIAIMSLWVGVKSLSRLKKTAKTQKQGTEQIEKAIQDVRQSIRRSSAWICLAIIVLALAVLASGLSSRELHP